jgi:hypothetical protein
MDAEPSKGHVETLPEPIDPDNLIAPRSRARCRIRGRAVTSGATASSLGSRVEVS